MVVVILSVQYNSVNLAYPLKIPLSSDEFYVLKAFSLEVKQSVLAALSFVSIRSKLTKWLSLIA